MDEARFHAFYEQTVGSLRAYLRSMLTDQHMADDLLQESYFRLLKAELPDAMETAHRRNYLYRIATNLVQDHRRSRKLEPLPEDSPAPSTDFGDSAHDIGKAFAHLKPRERDALWLAYVECFDHREIAQILRMGTASIRPMLARALRKLPRCPATERDRKLTTESQDESVVAANMRHLASEFAQESRPTAAAMRRRLSLRMRQEKARRAQLPVIWMTRVFLCCGLSPNVVLARDNARFFQASGYDPGWPLSGRHRLSRLNSLVALVPLRS